MHLIRNSLEYVSWKDRKAVVAELKTIYRAETAEKALAALETFSQGPWGKKYPPIAWIWKRQWEQVTPFFAYPAEVRKIIYTTNAIESLHMQLRKIIKNRGHFPNNDAAIKLLYLALRNITKDWKMSAREWKSAMNQFAILLLIVSCQNYFNQLASHTKLRIRSVFCGRMPLTGKENPLHKEPHERNLPAANIIAAEIVEDLEAALT